MTEEHTDDHWFIVIIDGDAMPLGSNFYRRRDALGLGVRGKRQQNNGFAIVSEGIVITESESLARLFYQIAQEAFEEQLKIYPDHSPTIRFGTVVLTDLKLTEADREFHAELAEFWAKRGRRKLPIEWYCECQECDNAWIENSARPIGCPECGGVWVNWVPRA